MITSKFIHKQRLGNQLFIYASLWGIALKNNEYVFLEKDWDYKDYFISSVPVEPLNFGFFEWKEKSFEYENIVFSNNINKWVISGYRQSYKYWENESINILGNIVPFKIKETALSFKQEYIDKADKILSFIPYKKKIAIHVRRGDYVDNPNYVLLPPIYYIKALIDNFPDWRNYGIMIFSDDIPYCRVHFGCLENAYFADGNSDIEDLILMSRCDHFIISNSTFAWWGTYLSNKEDKIVIRPKYYFDGNLKHLDTKDFWL